MATGNACYATAQNVWNLAYDAAFTYSTIRVAKIHSFSISIVYRIIQLSIIAYIVG